MEENQVVGYRFHPTDEEVINHYLKNKILGKLWLINNVNEININSHDPDSFPSLSKIKSKDSTYYFFAPTIYISAKKTARKRSTRSGYWKPTGTDRIIKDKSGNKIGEKKTLVYHLGKVNNGVRTPWVMHEYLIKCWSHPDPESYVMCKIKYKGEDGEPSQSLVSDSNTVKVTPPEEIEQPVKEENGLSLDDLDFATPIMNEQVEEFDQNTFFDGLSDNDLTIPMSQQVVDFSDSNNNNLDALLLRAPYDVAENNDVTWDPLDPDTWFNEQKLIMQEDCNDYKPKKPLSGIIVGYNSDSEEEAESISATSYQGTLSPGDRFGSSSSNKHFPSCSSTDSCKDQETRLITRHRVSLKQDISRTIVAKTEKKKGSLVTQEKAMEKTHKNPNYIYLVKMIISLILLLAFIGNIVSVLSNVKT